MLSKKNMNFKCHIVVAENWGGQYIRLVEIHHLAIIKINK